MRRILLRLLLLAVFFNTAIGVPLHEAEHLRQAAPAISQGWGLLEADGDTTSSEHGEEVHGLCAWCLAHAQQATALASPSARHATVVEPATLPGPGLAVAFAPSPGRWPFASRDPPRKLT